MSLPPDRPSANDLAEQRTDLAKQRTLLSFERTRMAKDRTMFAMLRTSLSMIGFGFTIFSFFRTLGSYELLGGAVPPQAPARFGLSLVVMGVLVLVHGIWFDRASTKRLDSDRAMLVADGLLPETRAMPPSSIQWIALLLLLIALFAILSIAARAGPFA
jgi:putative membrane protein